MKSAKPQEVTGRRHEPREAHAGEIGNLGSFLEARQARAETQDPLLRQASLKPGGVQLDP